MTEPAARTISIPDLLDRKRQGGRLSRTELQALVGGYVAGDVPDYQVSAWLMAVCWRGLDADELTDLTEIMAASGRQLNMSALDRPVVDKHSTGGVGDKVSLVVVPLVAACGAAVAKLSGRGLGFTGGTLDKLESIPGLRVGLSPDAMLEQVKTVGAAIAGQSADLAPADGKLYALRDVTGTVASVPLIASSVMSKKLAAGAPAIVLDVKAGRGAFMHDEAEARELAMRMVEIAAGAGRRATAFVTDMDQPLGRTVGNALEVREAADLLRSGTGDPRLLDLVTALASEMLVVAGAVRDLDEARGTALSHLHDGSGYAKLREMVAAQGGDPTALDEPDRLPLAPFVSAVASPRHGVITDVEPVAVARAANRLGAGRERKGDPIDHAVGLVLDRTVGDAVKQGQPLVWIHARDEAHADEARRLMARAFAIGDEAPPSRPVVMARVSTTDRSFTRRP